MRTASNLSVDTVQEAGTLEENVLAFLNNRNIPIKKVMFPYVTH